MKSTISQMVETLENIRVQLKLQNVELKELSFVDFMKLLSGEKSYMTYMKKIINEQPIRSCSEYFSGKCKGTVL